MATIQENIDNEVDVLKIVYTALKRLPDDDSRQRVVEYCLERAARKSP